MFVDVVFEADVGDVHLSESREDLVCTGIEIIGNTPLQFFYLYFRRFVVGRNPAAVKLGEFFKHRVKQRSRLAEISIALLAFLVRVGAAPALSDLLRVLVFQVFVFVIRLHKPFSFLQTVERVDQPLQPFLFCEQ